jgi:hypothetical protein
MNILGPAMAGAGALGQMNQARNAGKQQQGFNQLQQQQAMQQQQMFQGALPGYSQVLQFLAKRAGLGGFNMPTTMPQQQGPIDDRAMWKPFEIGGEEFHGLGSRLRGKGDGDAERMYGAGDPSGMLQRRQQVPGTGMTGPTQQPQSPLNFSIAPGPVAAGTPFGAPAPNQQMLNRRPNGLQRTTNRTGGPNDQQMGIWNNPEDRMRMMAAQDDIDRYQGQQSNRLRHNLAGRGLLDSGMYSSGEQELSENALQSFADFRRQMAIGAGGEEERRMQQFLGALAPAMGMSAPAANTFSQLGQQAGQQQAGSNQALQGLFQLFGQLFGPQPGQAKMSGGSGRSNNYGGGLGGL